MGECITTLKLPALVSDNMVLQRNAKVRIWGWAEPEKEINLIFSDKTYLTSVNKQGSWEVTMSDLKAGGPYDMLIECGIEKRLVKNILVGDVWVLGGQSNMELPISRTLDLFEEEVKGAECSMIRKFQVPQVYNFKQPQDEITGGEWVSVNPETVYSFSAAGYFFAKYLYSLYHIPIGLIHTAVGGTPAEAWLCEETLQRYSRFDELLASSKNDDYVNETKLKDEKRSNEWYYNLYKEDQGLHDEKGEWFTDTCDTSEWSEMKLPGSFMGTQLEGIYGAVWFRKEIQVTKDMLKGKAKHILGTIIDGDDTYLNGVKVGSTGYMYPPRRYDIPEGLLKEGTNTITVRVILTQNIGAFVTDMPYMIRANGKEIPLSGIWKYKIGVKTQALKPSVFFQYRPTGLYNGMIYPISKYNICGVLWYQGESNTGSPDDYEELFSAVISDWRKLWDNNKLPFLFVQLANYCPWRMEPEISGWAKVRDAQRRALKIPNTGMAVTIDVGGYNELHPQNKKAVGERLALWARNIVYKESIIASGPLYAKQEIVGNRVYISFASIGSGLTFTGDKLCGFSICGKDGVFYEAEAFIDNDRVVVCNGLVKEPVVVRYGWADNPEEANLYNKEGLPASPFSSI